MEDQITYDGYLKILSRSTPSFQDVYFAQGMRFDSLTADYSTHGRWFMTDTGTWNEPDPRGFAAGSMNLDEAEGNAPTEGTDPSGNVLLVIGDKAKDNVVDQYKNKYSLNVIVREVQTVNSWRLGDDPKFAEPTPNGTNIYMILPPRFLTPYDLDRVDKQIDATEKGGIGEALKLGLRSMVSPPDGPKSSNRVFSIPENGKVEPGLTGSGYLQIGESPFELDTPLQSGYARSTVRSDFRNWQKQAEDKLLKKYESVRSTLPPRLAIIDPNASPEQLAKWAAERVMLIWDLVNAVDGKSKADDCAANEQAAVALQIMDKRKIEEAEREVARIELAKYHQNVEDSDKLDRNCDHAGSGSASKRS